MSRRLCVPRRLSFLARCLGRPYRLPRQVLVKGCQQSRPPFGLCCRRRCSAARRYSHRSLHQQKGGLNSRRAGRISNRHHQHPLEQLLLLGSRRLQRCLVRPLVLSRDRWLLVPVAMTRHEQSRFTHQCQA
jgi:hypothetical protein